MFENIPRSRFLKLRYLKSLLETGIAKTSDSRRCEDFDDQCHSDVYDGGDRIVFGRLAGQIILQGTEVDSSRGPVSVRTIRSGRRMNELRDDGGSVSGARTCETTEGPTPERITSTLVDGPAAARPL